MVGVRGQAEEQTAQEEGREKGACRREAQSRVQGHIEQMGLFRWAEGTPITPIVNTVLAGLEPSIRGKREEQGPGPYLYHLYPQTPWGWAISEARKLERSLQRPRPLSASQAHRVPKTGLVRL